MNEFQFSTRRLALQSLGLLAASAAIPHAHAADDGAWRIVTHKVADFDQWKPVFDSTAAIKRPYGWKQSSVFAVDGDRNHVMVMEEFSSLERAKALAASPELRQAMGKAGVTRAPEIRFISAVSRASA